MSNPINEAIRASTYSVRYRLSPREQEQDRNMEEYVRERIARDMATHIMAQVPLTLVGVADDGSPAYEMRLSVLRPHDMYQLILDASKALRGIYDDNGYRYGYSFDPEKAKDEKQVNYNSYGFPQIVDPKKMNIFGGEV